MTMRCPEATRNRAVNNANRQRAFSLAQYGSRGPASQSCSTCEHYDRETVAVCLPNEPEAGYCDAYDFVALPRLWCRAWAPKR